MSLIRLYPEKIKNSFQLILESDDYHKKLLIVLSDLELINIMSVIEQNQDTPYSILHHIAQKLDIRFEKVMIYEFDCGIFRTKIFYQQNHQEYESEVPVTEAISLAIDQDIPIFTTQDLINEVGISATNIDDDTQDVEPESESSWNLLPTSKLYELLNNAVENEDYETAIQIRDEITRREIL